jgi:ElaB/YqjD/DUF883 family membrane-anchored ribosome-binding protein
MVNKRKDSRSAVEQSVEETRRDIGERIEEISSQLMAGGPEVLEKLERSLNDLRADLQGSLENTHGMLGDELEAGRDEIREHPLLAVGIAVAAGVVIGLILGKGKD